MGGVSKGKPVTNDGTMVFSGKLSLENNGGFSSLRTGDRKYDFTGKDGFVLRVKGDGRTYKLRIETDARFNGLEIGYQADFKTKAGKFIEVTVPFDSFEPGWRGRDLDGPPLDLSKVEELGLVLADGKEKPRDRGGLDGREVGCGCMGKAGKHPCWFRIRGRNFACLHHLCAFGMKEWRLPRAASRVGGKADRIPGWLRGVLYD